MHSIDYKLLYKYQYRFFINVENIYIYLLNMVMGNKK
jgi:hypothetical protein